MICSFVHLCCIDAAGPCRAIAPEFEALAAENAPFIEPGAGVAPPIMFVKVDVDKVPEAAQKYGVSSLPTFVFLKGDKEVARFSGANVAALKANVKNYS